MQIFISMVVPPISLKSGAKPNQRFQARRDTETPAAVGAVEDIGATPRRARRFCTWARPTRGWPPHVSAESALYRCNERQETGRSGGSEEGGRDCGPQRLRTATLVKARGMAAAPSLSRAPESIVGDFKSKSAPRPLLGHFVRRTTASAAPLDRAAVLSA